MTSSLLRREVLNSFKKLHRTRQAVFKNDIRVSESARKEINDHYKKNKVVADEESIKNLIKFANDVDSELKSVVELEQTSPESFRINLRPEIFTEMEKPKKKVRK